MHYLIAFSLLAFSFFCGAVPTGYLLVKLFKHQDIREIGSGNIGSTNVRRAAGRGFSFVTQIIDILKGVLPVSAALFPHWNYGFRDDHMFVVSAVALASILGHDFSPFLKFRGGKGVNTTIGAFILLAPLPVVMGIGVFYALRFRTPIVSVRSLALGFTISVLTLLLGPPPAVIAASWIASFLIVIRHKDNIQRLLQHNELK
jgi:glycerol-3-phosphate acyltransferase PlsY